MYISKLSIRNFRNFRNACFHFRKGTNTLIGENGSGKTNAFHAIRLLLDDSLARRITHLRETDFNRAMGPWRGHWISISIEFADLDTSEGCQILKHATGHMAGTNTGTYTFYFRPKKEIRSRLFAASGSQASVQAILDAITINDYESVFTGRASGDLCDDTTYTSVVGDIANATFPSPDLDDTAVLGTTVYQSIDQEVSCTFVKALRDVVSDLRNYRDSPLLNLLRGSEKKIDFADAGRITTAITELNKDISSLDEIRTLSLGIQGTLHDTVGYSYAPSIDIKSSLPADIEKLLQGLALRVSDPLDGTHEGDLSELSLGGANLIYLSLKLLEYELKSSTDRVAHFLLIEEPESHIHTHIQKTLFEKYSDNQTQVIVSTHSTHISAASKIRSVNILAKRTQEAVSFRPSNNLSETQCAQIERYLDAVRSTLLFAKGVILVEGDAELILIPSLVKQVFGVALDELGLSLISMSSAFFSNIATVFHDDRIRRACSILTDSDTAFVPLPADPQNDSKSEKAVRASQKAGAERASLLNTFCNGNRWVSPFYARHTFEVDFLLGAGNVKYIVKTLDTLFAQRAAIDNSKALLESTDIAVAGVEMLRLAKAHGKGWFALQLAANLDCDVTIPEYILDAIAFAAKHTSETRTMHQVLCHRLKNYDSKGVPVAPLAGCLTMAPTNIPGTLTAFVDQLIQAHPNDCFASLWRKLQSAVN